MRDYAGELATKQQEIAAAQAEIVQLREAIEIAQDELDNLQAAQRLELDGVKASELRDVLNMRSRAVNDAPALRQTIRKLNHRITTAQSHIGGLQREVHDLRALVTVPAVVTAVRGSSGLKRVTSDLDAALATWPGGASPWSVPELVTVLGRVCVDLRRLQELAIDAA